VAPVIRSRYDPGSSILNSSTRTHATSGDQSIPTRALAGSQAGDRGSLIGARMNMRSACWSIHPRMRNERANGGVDSRLNTSSIVDGAHIEGYVFALWCEEVDM
jgi:hypothetical protein